MDPTQPRTVSSGSLTGSSGGCPEGGRERGERGERGLGSKGREEVRLEKSRGEPAGRGGREEGERRRGHGMVGGSRVGRGGEHWEAWGWGGRVGERSGGGH